MVGVQLQKETLHLAAVAVVAAAAAVVVVAAVAGVGVVVEGLGEEAEEPQVLEFF